MIAPARRLPALLVAAVLLGLQAVAAVVFAVLTLLSVNPSRAEVGIGVGVIMLGYGVLLAAVARGVVLARRWSRSLAVMSQLILLLLGWTFRQPATFTVGAIFAVVAVAALVCLLLPSSTRAFLPETPPA